MDNQEEKLQKIITSQKEEIQRLKKQLEDRDRIIDITETYQVRLKNQLQELEEKMRECDTILREIAEMKNNYNKVIFKGRWNFLRHLL